MVLKNNIYYLLIHASEVLDNQSRLSTTIPGFECSYQVENGHVILLGQKKKPTQTKYSFSVWTFLHCYQNHEYPHGQFAAKTDSTIATSSQSDDIDFLVFKIKIINCDILCCCCFCISVLGKNLRPVLTAVYYHCHTKMHTFVFKNAQ